MAVKKSSESREPQKKKAQTKKTESKKSGTQKSATSKTGAKKSGPKKVVAEKSSGVKKSVASSKKTDSKKSPRTSTKKSEKVSLDKKSVVICVLLIVLCLFAFLLVNFLLSGKKAVDEATQSGSQITKPENVVDNDINKTPQENDNIIEENSSESLEEKDSGIQKRPVKIPDALVDPIKPSTPELDLEIVPDDEANPQLVENVLSQMIPPAKNGAKICLVLDDAGLSSTNVACYTSLPFDLTVAVLPKLSQSKECARTVVAAKKELVLHQPMQAHDYASGTTPNPGPGAILPGMSRDEIYRTLAENLLSLEMEVKGFNNHEGSLVTEDRNLMSSVLTFAKERGLYFLDSRTSSQSVALQLGQELGTDCYGRFAPFLDNEIQRDKMLDMLIKGLDVANKNGYAVLIGHVDKSVKILPDLLLELYPLLLEKGYGFATISKL